MSTSHRNRNHKDLLDQYIDKVERGDRSVERPEDPGEKHGRGWLKLLGVILVLYLVFGGIRNFTGNNSFTFVPGISNVFNTGPSEGLLNRMNNRMIEMGYTGLSHDDLRELRSAGVTATYISNVRALGFEDLTLEEAVSLSRANASSTFLAMMLELGYDDLTVEDFVRLRDAGVTAHYTSNVHDLGYRDVTPDQLVRMVRIGVTTSLIRQLQDERGEDVSMEEIIRYRISNQ